MNRVVIMSGLPGCGKSTMARKMVDDERSMNRTVVVLSADDYHMVDGEYKFDPRKAGEAHKYCLSNFAHLLFGINQPSLIIVDNTNTTAHEISPYYRVAEALGWDVSITRIHADPLECYKRTIHAVPIATIMSMYRNLLTDPLPPYWKATHLVAEWAGKPHVIKE